MGSVSDRVGDFAGLRRSEMVDQGHRGGCGGMAALRNFLGKLARVACWIVAFVCVAVFALSVFIVVTDPHWRPTQRAKSCSRDAAGLRGRDEGGDVLMVVSAANVIRRSPDFESSS